MRLFVALFACLATPAAAEAQWYFIGAFGGNHTAPAVVTIDQPGLNTSLRFDTVHFAARPLDSPQYYDGRIGRLLGPSRRFGIEVEFIHLKVIGLTSRSVHITGHAGEATVDERAPMDTRVAEYQMSHGLNFVLVNLVWRMPLGGGRNPERWAVVARGGAGQTLPHSETNVGGRQKNIYEWAGPAVHGSVGIAVRLHGRVSMVADYKLTFARPRILIADGHGQTTTLTHQVAAGLAIGLTR